MNAQNGMSAAFLAEEAFRCHQICIGESQDWESVAKDSWENVANVAIMTFALPANDEHSELRISAKALAEKLHDAWVKSETSAESWEGLSLRQRCAWEAVGRHLLNGIGADSRRDVDLARLREMWPGWVAGKC